MRATQRLGWVVLFGAALVLGGCNTIGGAFGGMRDDARSAVTAFSVPWHRSAPPAPPGDSRLVYTSKPNPTTPNIWPVEHPDLYISSPFGPRGSQRGGPSRLHKGIDLVCPKHTPIRAAADGKAVFVGRMRGYGNVIIVRHDDTYQTYYAHLEDMYIEKGKLVQRGDIIGTVGRTGNATTDHLHYEVRRDGVAINPETYLPNVNEVRRL